mmetsp:Transcript_97674/g.173056  ORF Transcript_97674/g.173056 Transcript_97674/m.173056 type:complete len:91 (+) Transcript_97674:11-283(+)
MLKFMLTFMMPSKRVRIGVAIHSVNCCTISWANNQSSTYPALGTTGTFAVILGWSIHCWSGDQYLDGANKSRHLGTKWGLATERVLFLYY